MAKDTIYRDREGQPGTFAFNAQVAGVFPDMLARSIPGYEATLDAIGQLAATRVAAGSHCYDLGCSLGAAALAMQRQITGEGCRIIAVDSAAAMVARCRELVAEQAAPDGPPVDVIEGDVRDVDIRNASMVVLNYTLQFVPAADRAALMARIAAGTRDNGVLVLSEKVVDADPAIDALLIELHHDFKRRNAYSELEISRKRAALENVLVPERVEAHLERLRAAGYRHAGVWLRCFNFVSILAIR